MIEKLEQKSNLTEVLTQSTPLVAGPTSLTSSLVAGEMRSSSRFKFSQVSLEERERKFFSMMTKKNPSS